MGGAVPMKASQDTVTSVPLKIQERVVDEFSATIRFSDDKPAFGTRRA